jgi:hypothetical protein
MPEEKTGSIAKCQFCGAIHSTPCPWVKAIEYHPNDSVKRVEFHDPARPFSQVIQGMEPLGAEFAKAWDDNTKRLYEP